MNPLKLTLARACDLSLHPGLSRRTEPWALLPGTRDDGLAWRRPARRSLSHSQMCGPPVGTSRAKALGEGVQMPVAFAPGRRT